MKRGDAELASVMRKLLADDDTVVDFYWVNRDSVFEFTVHGGADITEEEAQAIEEALNG